ncbi:hypothetical protein [Bradyrhizobium prioriisuperbiae]|uniref:hypothetical protein n=1 Tax=Bradyrhizobium prioriisuperbiae TaxID=2854389 RepID=UPI0028EDB2D0|nr:hypothetical protein [Bradyrhizobium prioritasuperba]
MNFFAIAAGASPAFAQGCPLNPSNVIARLCATDLIDRKCSVRESRMFNFQNSLALNAGARGNQKIKTQNS